MSSVENRLSLIGREEEKTEPVSAETKEELLALTEKLSVTEISTQLRLEIVTRMRQVLGWTEIRPPNENGRMLGDHPPPSSVSVG